MPLVQIHLIHNTYTPTQIRSIADTIQSVMESHFHAPTHDRYQLITQHEPYEVICEDTGLGPQCSNKLILIQIFQQGRDAGTKERTYQEFFERLSRLEGLGTGGQDLLATCCANGREDWSFGDGRAQFLTGEL